MSWIKVRTNLHEDPRVIAIASGLRRSIAEVVGLLVRFWSYADQHSTDGTIGMVSPATVDAIVGCEGFAEALAKVGWITDGADGVTLPRYSEHNGQTAKSRAQTARAVTRHRERKAQIGGDDGVSRGEERRGEEKKTRRNAAGGGTAWI